MVFTKQNIANMHAHLLALDPAAQFFTYQLVAENPDIVSFRGLTHVITLGKDAMVRHFERYQSRGSAVFVTINQTDGRGRKQENITHLRAIWQDCDNEAAIKALPPMLPPSLVIQTSQGKLHRYWVLKEKVPNDEKNQKIWRALMGCLVSRFHSDPSAVDTSRVLRLAGANHLKTGRMFMSNIVESSLEFRYSLEQLASIWLGDSWGTQVEDYVRRDDLNRAGIANWRDWLEEQEPVDMGSSGVVLRSESALWHAQQIVSGANFNNSLCSLAAHLAGVGIAAKTTHQFLEELMAQVANKDARWQARMRNLPSIVNSAITKFSWLHAMRFSVNQRDLAKDDPTRIWYQI